MKKFLMVIVAVMVVMTAQADEKQLKWKGVAGCPNCAQTVLDNTIVYLCNWSQSQTVEFLNGDIYTFNFQSVSDARNFRKAIMSMTDSKEEMVAYLEYVRSHYIRNEPIGAEVVIEKAKHPLYWEHIPNSRRCLKAMVEKTPVYHNTYEWDQVVQIGNNGPMWRYHFIDKGDAQEFRQMMKNLDKNITVQELGDFLNSVKNAFRY